MDDLTVALLLLAAFMAVCAVALGLPDRLLDWIDRQLLAPNSDDPAELGGCRVVDDPAPIRNEIVQEPTP